MDPEDPIARALLDRRAELEAQRGELRASVERIRAARSLDFTDDEHDPEGSTASLDQAREVALLARTEQTIAELDAARQRLAAGDYGRCEHCGRPIARDRLLARPEARRCVTCPSAS